MLAHRILFFKVWSRHDRTNDSQLCPAGLCYMLRIILPNSVDRTAMRTCFGAKYPHFRDTRVRFKVQDLVPCHTHARVYVTRTYHCYTHGILSYRLMNVKKIPCVVTSVWSEHVLHLSVHTFSCHRPFLSPDDINLV